MRNLVVTLALLSTAALAQVPHKVGYQGLLLKSDGTPETGTVSITFTIFDASTAGNQLWTETQTVALSNGYYATNLGEVTALPDSVFSGPQRWLELTIGGSALTPRMSVASMPYAITANNVAGGTVNASSVSVNGTPVVDGMGTIVSGLSSGGGVNFSSGTFSTTAGGDLSGSLNSATVARIRGVNVSATAPTAGQVLTYSGGNWTPTNATNGTVTSVATGAGLTGGPITGSGTISIPNGGVSNTMLANSSVSVNASTGLSGGGAVALGGATTLAIDPTVVPRLNAASNTFAGTVGASSFLAGYQIVNASAVMSVLWGTCPSGSGNCYTAGGQGVNATCPAGTNVLGGGCNTSNYVFTYIGQSFPMNNGWHCTAVSLGGQSTNVLTAYAICANLQ